MEKKYLAYIWPLEPYQNVPYCACRIRYISGDLTNREAQAVLTTDIYKYYFWGVTMEVVILDESDRILEVRDVKAEDVKEFKISLFTALTYDAVTHKTLCTDGFVYRLDQTAFYNHCKEAMQNIFSAIRDADNIVMHLYVIMGKVIYVSFDRNVRADEKRYKYVINRGFVTQNEKLLRSMNIGSGSIVADPNHKMSQEEIDILLKEYL